jgi:hypothetical protein
MRKNASAFVLTCDVCFVLFVVCCEFNGKKTVKMSLAYSAHAHLIINIQYVSLYMHTLLSLAYFAHAHLIINIQYASLYMHTLLHNIGRKKPFNGK